MTVTSGLLFEASAGVLVLAGRLLDEADSFGGAIGDFSDEVQTLHGGWQGPRPRAIDRAGDTYVESLGKVVGALESLADVCARWAAFAAQVASDLQSAETNLAFLDDVRDQGVESPGVNASERGGVASRIAALSESWNSSCVRYVGDMEAALRVLADAVDATVDGLPYPPGMLISNGYLIAISQMIYLYNYPGGNIPEPEPPLTFSDVDPSGRLQAMADSMDETMRENPWMFTASETANDGDIDSADNKESTDDIFDAATWDVAERQVRQLNEQFGWGLDDAEIAAMTSELMVASWLRIADDDVDETDYGDDWVHAEMEDLPEDDSDHQATLNPYGDLRAPAAWNGTTPADQLRLWNLLQPWLVDPNDHYTWDEFAEDMAPFTLLGAPDPGAIWGANATFWTRTFEIATSNPFGRVARRALNGIEFVVDRLRGVDNVSEVASHADEGAEAVDAATQFARHGDEAAQVLTHNDEGVAVFRETAQAGDGPATEQVDDVYDNIDDTATTDETATGGTDGTDGGTNSADESADAADAEPVDDTPDEHADGEAESDDADSEDSADGSASDDGGPDVDDQSDSPMEATDEDVAIPDAVGLDEAEQATAGRLLELPEMEGRTLYENPDIGYDYVDDLGNNYDAMGEPDAYGQHWNEGRFTNAIDGHLLKTNCTTVIDLAGASAEQIATITEYVEGLPPGAQARIWFVGG